MAEELFQKLLEVDKESGKQAWRSFLFNLEEARLLKSLMTEERAQVLFQAGTLWNGDGWNSTSASKVLYNLTGVPLVSGEFGHYRDCWMYAIAVYWDVGSQVTLQDSVANAAFQLAQACSSEGDDGELGEDDEDYESDSEQMVFDWEETRVQLPADLAHLWKKYGGKDHEQFNVKQFLAATKKFDNIPLKPPENNFGVAGAARFGKVDKALRFVQQILLHLLRVQASIYERIQVGKATGNEVRSLLQ